MAISFPSRTAAIMPHPHEQKLQDVVNSLTLASFNFSVAALTAGMSMNSPTASPAAAPTPALNQSRRLMVGRFLVQASASFVLSEDCLLTCSSISLLSLFHIDSPLLP